jgi:hypothetical protein
MEVEHADIQLEVDSKCGNHFNFMLILPSIIYILHKKLMVLMRLPKRNKGMYYMFNETVK